MTTRDDALQAIAEYERRFRRDDLKKLEISGLYALFPSTAEVAVGVAGNWPDRWPYAERAGVYLIFDEKLQVLYVGKASFKSSLGGRLYNYFREDKDGNCRIRHEGWSRPPRYVLTVAVSEDMRFEASALEECLITTLKPTDNTVGIGPCD